MTSVHIPLSDTDMASDSGWAEFTFLTRDQAVDMLVDAIRRRPRSIENPLGKLYSLVYQVAPGPADYLQNTFHRTRPNA